MAPTDVSVATAPVTESKAELYRAFPETLRLPFAQGTELAYNSLTGARDFMSGSVSRFLQTCDRFATLDGHVQQLCTQLKLPASQTKDLSECLKKLASDGFLVSREQLIRDYVLAETGKSRAAQDVRLSHVGIPTCNRPDNLHSCLTSYAECIRQFDRDMHFTIADDSRDDVVCALNIEALQAVKRQFGINISYIGKAEKEALAETLAKQSGLPRSIVDFAILNPENCPITTGANRNVLLLSTVGLPFVHADDDTFCRAAPVPDSRAHVSLSSQFNLYENWFDEALMAADDWPAVDLFSLHERFLGKSVSACVGGATANLDIDHAASALYRRLKRSGGRVLVTALGGAGDSGLGNSNLLLEYDGATRARLMQSEAVYRRALDSHRQVRGVLNPTIGDSYFCVAMNLALDNRDKLPPFMPVQRKSDSIFAQFLTATVSDACFGFMPWTILHGKPGTMKREFDGGRSRISDIFFMLFAAQTLSHGLCEDTDANLRDIGAGLMRIGSMPQSEFEEFVMITAWAKHTRKIAHLQNLLKIYAGQPPYWANDVAARIKDLRKALSHPQYVVATDLAAAFGEEAARTMAPRLIYRFGELLQHWTDIRQAAADLGFDLARKI